MVKELFDDGTERKPTTWVEIGIGIAIGIGIGTGTGTGTGMGTDDDAVVCDLRFALRASFVGRPAPTFRPLNSQGHAASVLHPFRPAVLVAPFGARHSKLLRPARKIQTGEGPAWDASASIAFPLPQRQRQRQQQRQPQSDARKRT